MPLSLLFWVCYVVTAVLSIWAAWPLGRPSAPWLAVMVLIFILGLRAFGFIVTN